MKMTDRDIEILRFINDFGFCEMPQIERKFNVKKPRSYKIMRRLIKAGLVIHERVFHNRHGIFRLSQHGARHTELPAMANIPIGIYQHQLAIIEVYFKLIQQYPDATWVSERHLKQEKFINGFGKRGHVADGMLILPNEKQIALEIELTLKGNNRLVKIIKSYASQFSIKEVWYYCSEETINKVARLVSNTPYIKIFRLKERIIPD